MTAVAALPSYLCTRCRTQLGTHEEVGGLFCRGCCTCTWPPCPAPDPAREPARRALPVPKGNGSAGALALDSPTCPQCGCLMVRLGFCHRCGNCGESSGCS